MKIDAVESLPTSPTKAMKYLFATLLGLFCSWAVGQASPPEALVTNAEKRMYHDVRLDELRPVLRELLKHAPFKSNQKLVEVVKAFDQRLTRDTAGKYIDEFKFLASLDLPESFLKTQGKLTEYDFRNIRHLASHALGDIYMTAGNYPVSIEYFQDSLFKTSYFDISGTTVSKDQERLLFDLAEACYLAKNKDRAYAYLIGLVVGGERLLAQAERRLTAYLKDDDRRQFKKDLDAAFQTIRLVQDDAYAISFRGVDGYLFPMFAGSPEWYRSKVQKTAFYRALNE